MQRKEIIWKIDDYIGIDKLFRQLGLKNISRNSSNIYCTCPFHEGADSPTGFAFNVEKGFGYCFTRCHKSYSLADVVMKVNNYTFIEAITYLADLAGVYIDFDTSRKRVNNDNLSFLKKVKKATSINLNTDCKPFEPTIIDTFIPILHTVLRQEGFDNDVRYYFNLGYCQSGYFQDRITIPIDYISGNYISVSGRSILPDHELEMMNIRKYKIHFGTDKSKTLYNISRAKSYIQKKREVIVVEGFKSVWRLHQWGIKNAVATMGSTISKEQLFLLLEFGVKIIVCGDRDEAGKKLNKEIVEKARNYSDIAVLDMFLLDAPEKSSISDITKHQYELLYCRKKEY